MSQDLNGLMWVVEQYLEENGWGAVTQPFSSREEAEAELIGWQSQDTPTRVSKILTNALTAVDHHSSASKNTVTNTVHHTSDTLEVYDLDHFIHILSRWHSSKVELLQHMQQIPPGSEVEILGGTTLILQGDALEGFKAGISLSLMELGKLPFSTQIEELEAPNDPVKSI